VATVDWVSCAMASALPASARARSSSPASDAPEARPVSALNASTYRKQRKSEQHGAEETQKNLGDLAANARTGLGWSQCKRQHCLHGGHVVGRQPETLASWWAGAPAMLRQFIGVDNLLPDKCYSTYWC
jgi:hypothetical protein